MSVDSLPAHYKNQTLETKVELHLLFSWVLAQEVPGTSMERVRVQLSFEQVPGT